MQRQLPTRGTGALLTLLLSSFALADVTTWTFDGSGNWTDATSWSNGEPTNATFDVVIDDGDTAATVSLSESRAIGGLTLGSDDILRIEAIATTPVTLTASTGFTNDGAIQLTGSSSANAALSLTSGTLSNSATGVLHFQTGGTGARSFSGNLTNQGVVIVDTTTTFDKAGANYINNAQFTINLPLTISNAGTFEQAAGTFAINSTLFYQLNGGGLLHLTGGTLDLNAAMNLGHAVLQQDGGEFKFTSGYTIYNTYRYNGGTISGTPLLGVGTRFEIAETATQPFSVNMVGNSTFAGHIHVGQIINIDPTIFAEPIADGGVTNDGSIIFGGTGNNTRRFMITNGTLRNTSSGVMQLKSGDSGSLIVFGDVINEGIVSIIGSTTLTSGTFSNVNQFTVAASKSFIVGSAGTFNQETGTIVTNGTFSLQNSGVLNFNGGTMQLNGSLTLLSGGKVNFRGGSITSTGSIVANSGCTVNLMAGSMGGTADAKSGSVFNISGGTLGDSFDAMTGSTINISGGSIGNDFDVDSTSIVNVYGTSFALGANDITSTLTPNTPFTVTDRNVLLTAILSDASLFDFNLSSSNLTAQDYLHSGASLTLILVLPGDFNRDNEVDAADYLFWRTSLGSSVSTRGAGADGNFDGEVTQADYNVWAAHLGKTVGTPSAAGEISTHELAVPEPSAIEIALAGWIAVVCCKSARRQTRYPRVEVLG